MLQVRKSPQGCASALLWKLPAIMQAVMGDCLANTYATLLCWQRIDFALQVVKVFERILYAADEKEAKEAMEQVLEEYNQQARDWGGAFNLDLCTSSLLLPADLLSTPMMAVSIISICALKRLHSACARSNCLPKHLLVQCMAGVDLIFCLLDSDASG